MRKPFVLSLSAHLALFMLFFMQLNLVDNNNNIGTHEKIVAYIYQQRLSKHRQEKSWSLPIKEQAQKSSAGQSRITTSSINQAAQQTLGKEDELLTSLHNMIEAEINRNNFSRYTQKVYIAFTLFPDGHIANIHLLEPSESANLNLAVIKALNAIQPVTTARNFLSAPHELKIQIVFGVIT